MCGILGIVSDNKVIINNFKNALDKLKHRGPDDEGYLLYNGNKILQCSGSDTVEPLKQQLTPIYEVSDFKPFLFLGHRRLSIIDLSQMGHQPMEYNNGDLWIVYNGEIYNYVELKTELEKGYIFKTRSDTEVILASYSKYSYECLNKFNGMWAFCIWDKKKNILFCARDRFGVKPFYYFFDGENFAFASEVKSLIALPFVNTAPNSENIIPYLYFSLHDFGEQTFFQGIKQLLPGHFLIFDINTKSLEIKRYYEIRSNSELGTYDEGKAKLYSEEFFNLFKDAVKLRLRSDVPAGTSLSGGLDSSSIVCIMSHLLKTEPEYQKVTGKKIKSFTADFHNFHLSEKKYVDEVLLHCNNIEGYFVYPDADMLKKDLYDLIYYQEEPFGSLSIYAQYCVMKLAKNSGVKILLDGQGGDELLAGYIHKHVPLLFANYISQGRILDLLKEKYYLNIRYLLSTIFLFLPKSIQYKYLKLVNNRYLLNYDEKIEEIILDTLFKGFETKSLNENLRNEIVTRLPRLLKYEDRNSMAFNIETRLPFLDYRLVEYLLNLPAVYKIHNEYSKFILRYSMEDILPEKIRTRRDKIGFKVPQKEMLMGLHEHLELEILRDKAVSDFLIQYIDIDKVKNNYNTLVMQEKQEPLKGTLWRILNLGLWWKQFFKKN